MRSAALPCRRRALLLWPAAALSVPAMGNAAIRRIGVLALVPLTPAQRSILASGLGELGWPVERALEIQWRDAGGVVPRLESLARELAGAELLVAAGSQAAQAALKVALPVVFFYVGDPVGTGLVPQLARPGGLATGFGGIGPDLHAKMGQLLHEAVPAARRVALLFNSAFPTHGRFRSEIETTLAARGLEILPIALAGAQQIDAAFAEATRRGAQAAAVLAQPLLYDHGAALAQAALRHRLPSISGLDAHAQAGVLLTYSWRLEDDLRKVPDYVDKILRGGRPGDLPVQQPQRFHFSVNLATARQLGIRLSQALIVRADEVIE